MRKCQYWRERERLFLSRVTFRRFACYLFPIADLSNARKYVLKICLPFAAGLHETHPLPILILRRRTPQPPKKYITHGCHYVRIHVREGRCRSQCAPTGPASPASGSAPGYVMRLIGSGIHTQRHDRGGFHFSARPRVQLALVEKVNSGIACLRLFRPSFEIPVSD